MHSLKLSEVLGALSHALDLTEGQPPGHCQRCAYIGMHLADALQLAPQDRWDLYYTLLLKDLGCSSNAARVCALYLTDDLHFKRDFKMVGTSVPDVARFILGHTGLRSGLAQRFGAVLHAMREGSSVADELIQTRCQRGAQIALGLRFSRRVADGIHALDEHWDGSGRPSHLRGDDIPLFSRIALLAQVVDVFHVSNGREAALAEVRARSGSWLDPALVRAFEAVAQLQAFWDGLHPAQFERSLQAHKPGDQDVPLDDDYLDDIARAFGEIIDAKSPYTAGHSARVEHYADLVAQHMGIDAQRRRWLRRGSLLHDMGKLGVSNTVLDKPDKLDETEWQAVRMHPVHTEQILARLSPFAELAAVAGAHHEKLDGTGYPRGLTADAIALETRIITVADIFDAISADRPYRSAVPVDRTLDMMDRVVGTAIDPRCMAALREVVSLAG